MPNNNNDDLIAGIIGAAMLATAGYVGYRVIKALSGDDQKTLPNTQTIPSVASNYTPRYESSVSDDSDDDYYPDYEGDEAEDNE